MTPGGVAPSGPRVALMGAPGSGHDDLAAALELHLQAGAARAFELVEQLASYSPDRVVLLALDARRATAAQTDAEEAIRKALSASGYAYTVIHGSQQAPLSAALGLLYPTDGPAPRWQGVCEKCADPDCEFRLFTALRGSMAAGPAPV